MPAHRLTAAVVDQQAALYGHGCRAAGDAKVTFGTGAFALALTGPEIVRAPERGLLPTVAWRIGEDTVRAVDGGVYDAGAAVEWAARLGLFDDLAELDAFAEPPAIERGLAFVPALSGLACPHWDRSAGALWLGMTAGTTRRDLCQALLEGIALRTAEVIAAMAEQVVRSRPPVDRRRPRPQRLLRPVPRRRHRPHRPAPRLRRAHRLRLRRPGRARPGRGIDHARGSRRRFQA